MNLSVNTQQPFSSVFYAYLTNTTQITTQSLTFTSTNFVNPLTFTVYNINSSFEFCFYPNQPVYPSDLQQQCKIGAYVSYTPPSNQTQLVTVSFNITVPILASIYYATFISNAAMPITLALSGSSK